jgi:hypothetical protein
VSTVSMSSASVDQQINAGAGFTIEILPVTLPNGKRDAPIGYWLTNTGLLSPDRSLAAVFKLTDGQLLADGLIESTSPNVPNQVFAGSPPGSEGSISTQFTVNQGVVGWIYPTFEGGAATFYQGIAPQDSPVKRQSGQNALFASFNDPVDPSWSPVSLSAGRKSCHLFFLMAGLIYMCQSFQTLVLRLHLLVLHHLLVMVHLRHQPPLRLRYHLLHQHRN